MRSPNGGLHSFQPLVAVFSTGSGLRLLHGLARQDAEGNGYTCLYGEVGETFRNTLADVAVMRGLTGDHATQGDHGVGCPVSLVDRKAPADRCQLEGTRGFDADQSIGLSARIQECRFGGASE